MFENLNEINNKKSIIRIANLLILILIFHVLYVFSIYYSTKFSLTNPLIPKELAFEIFYPYSKKGVILTFGLLVVNILKLFKQNTIVILICLIILITYYFTSFQPDFSEYPK